MITSYQLLFYRVVPNYYWKIDINLRVDYFYRIFINIKVNSIFIQNDLTLYLNEAGKFVVEKRSFYNIIMQYI